MRKRILYQYLVLVVLGVLIMAGFISWLAHDLYKTELEERMTSSAVLMKRVFWMILPKVEAWTIMERPSTMLKS